MNPLYDVLIAGGGVVGLTAALAMARCGFSVALIDASPLENVQDKPCPDARVYAINKASQALFSELDVWTCINRQNISPYQRMHVWDESNGASIDFDSRIIAEPHLGFIIEESNLKNALLTAIKQNELIHLFPNNAITQVQHVGQNKVVSSDKQLRWEGRLLIVAEGAHSPTRERLEVELTSWSYEQQALVATVETEFAHQQTAYQVVTKQGPLAFLPLVNEHWCSIVWSVNTSHADYLWGLSDEAFNREMAEALDHRLGLTHLRSKRHKFPLTMRHAKNYVGPEWMLVGDAAHTIHPLAGLGLNVGLADVASWYGRVRIDKNALTSKKQLASYQRERKAAVWQTILLMEGLKRLFASSFLPVNHLRGLGLRWCNQLTPLKRLFIQHAAG